VSGKRFFVGFGLGSTITGLVYVASFLLVGGVGVDDYVLVLALTILLVLVNKLTKGTEKLSALLIGSVVHTLVVGTTAIMSGGPSIGYHIIVGVLLLMVCVVGPRKETN
jgi:hypothetical protein